MKENPAQSASFKRVTHARASHDYGQSQVSSHAICRTQSAVGLML
jgi:hypothetical protein